MQKCMANCWITRLPKAPLQMCLAQLLKLSLKTRTHNLMARTSHPPQTETFTTHTQFTATKQYFCLSGQVKKASDLHCFATVFLNILRCVTSIDVTKLAVPNDFLWSVPVFWKLQSFLLLSTVKQNCSSKMNGTCQKITCHWNYASTSALSLQPQNVGFACLDR